MMVAWWWIPIGIFFGAGFGFLVTAICAYDSIQQEKRKRWWEHEQREDS